MKKPWALGNRAVVATICIMLKTKLERVHAFERPILPPLPGYDVRRRINRSVEALELWGRWIYHSKRRHTGKCLAFLVAALSVCSKKRRLLFAYDLCKRSCACVCAFLARDATTILCRVPIPLGTVDKC